MSFKSSFNAGSKKNYSWDLNQIRRFEAWSASSPENAAKANEILLRSMGIPQKKYRHSQGLTLKPELRNNLNSDF